MTEKSPTEARSFPLLHNVQTGPGSHPASCTMENMGNFHLDKMAGNEDEHPTM
jgi:hypothetical protein